MESRERDPGRPGTPPPRAMPLIMALPVHLSPHGTLRVPSNEHVLVHRSDTGRLQALRETINDETRRLTFNEEEEAPQVAIGDNEYLLPSLVEALTQDSGSEIDEEWEDYNEDQLRQILEMNEEDEEDIDAVNVEAEGDEMIQPNERPDNGLFVWSEDFGEFTGVEEMYQEQPGPIIQETSPINIFKTIWDRQIMEFIVEQTNKYAWEIIARASENENSITPGSRLNDWHETTVDELYTFFSIMMLMSLCNRGRIDEYWTTGILGMPCFRKIMSKNRFLLLLRFLHFVDNDDLTDNVRGYDRKIFKLGPLVEHCNRKFAQIYIPRKALSIDESLLLWKGRLSWLQCIRTKAARFGIKTYELCESESGYLLKMNIYTGKGNDSGQAVHGFTNATAKVVLRLSEGYLEKGHCLYMDNYYNSVGLARFLKQKRTDVVGTLNRRRVETPAEIKHLNDRRMQRGAIVARHSGDVTVLAWKDVKLVSMISTFHKNDIAPGRRANEEYDKPLVVLDYNKYMGGVDLKDQKISMYLLERKRGLKWYVKVFRRLLNCSILNCFIIYKCQEGGRKMDHRQFRYALAETLSLERAHAQRIRPAAILHHDRYNGDHFPAHLESDDGRSNKRSNRHKRRACVQCRANNRRTEGNIICTGCNVFLCVGQCWREYHTPPN